MNFVTGGTGLVGSHLLVELSARNEPITAIYRSERKIQLVKKLFQFYLKEEAQTRFSLIRWEKADILDVPLINELIAGHQYVYHCAAIVSFVRRDFNKLIQVNRYGTANIVNACLQNDIKKLCFVSSTAAVGNKDIPDSALVTEEGKWILTDETSGYSISKYSAEKEVWRGIEEGLDAVIVNPSIIIGAGDWSESSLVIFNTIKRGLRFYSPGSNAFVDARDVAAIMVSLMESDLKNDRFLCVGVNAPFQTLFKEIAEQLGKKPPKYPVNRALMGLAWRISVFWAVITFRSPVITKSAAQSAFNNVKFSNDKIEKALSYQFYPLKESVSNAIQGRIDRSN